MKCFFSNPLLLLQLLLLLRSRGACHSFPKYGYYPESRSTRLGSDYLGSGNSWTLTHCWDTCVKKEKKISKDVGNTIKLISDPTVFNDFNQWITFQGCTSHLVYGTTQCNLCPRLIWPKNHDRKHNCLHSMKLQLKMRHRS